MSTETTTPPTTDSVDFTAAGKQLTDMVVANPMPSVLAAAATGAGLVALVALMARPRTYSVSIPKPDLPTSFKSPDVDSLKDQLADLVQRIAGALPSKDQVKDQAKQQVSDASDSVQSAWGSVREQASDMLDQLQPQISAATKLARDNLSAATQVARENPLWAAVIAGALGALLGSQLLGKSSDDKPS